MRGFFEFIRTQGVVGLAVGFILGGALTELVRALVTDLVNPVISVGLGKADNFASSTASVGGISFSYGHFLSVLINFLVIAAVVYFAVKGLGFDRLDKKKE
ncbi:MscL family protein [Candidatus Parcubacteria bacterium]|nr:MscL family protein [Candidatus Parcubacteria bacterium]